MSGPALLCVVGPPASGKTLLITSLTEALRQRGHRVAIASPRGDAATVFTLPNGGRVTMPRPVGPEEMPTLIASLDPGVTVLLVEGVTARGIPTLVMSPPDGSAHDTADADVLAVVASVEVAGDFARSGPGETHGLADLVEKRVLGITRKEEPAPSWRRLFRRSSRQ